MKILDGIAPLADRYDGFVLDLWGVVHDGRRPYPGVADALAALKARGKRVAFLSNAPRRSHVVDALLTGMGLDRAGIGGAAVVHDAPEVEHEAVVAVGERRDAVEDVHQEASTPTASERRAKPSRRSAAASSRLRRGTSAGPA